MPRSWIRRIALAIASTLAALAAAVLVARAWFPERALPRFKTVAHTRFHHVGPPDARTFGGEVEGRKVFVRTNEDGLRTPYSRDEFRGHAVRVAILGDSFVFGLGVERAFPAVTEALLRERLGRDDVAVLNAGVTSYSPFLEALQYEDVIRAYEPTVVALFVDVTDIGDDIIYERESTLRDGEVYFPPPDEKNYSYYKFELTVGGVLEQDRFFIYRHPLDVTRPYFERTLGHVDRIATEVARSGAEFLLVVFPRYHHWNKDECPRNWERKSYGLEEPYQFEFFRFFEETKAARGYPVLDLLPAFKATTEAPLVFHRDPHWNERGHAVVAAAIVEDLLRMCTR